MATNHTPSLRLNLPLFDQQPWDTDVNDNFTVIDGVLGQFFAIPNVAGVWKNNTQFVSGQIVFDPADGGQWQCQVTHTTPATGTFAQDRTANPTRWKATTSSAASSALQAAQSAAASATSATQSATSATNSANSAALSANKLPLTGGTLTGPLVLSGDPTAVLGAATKQYVDARVGGVGFLPLTGGTLTGALQLPLTAPTATTQATNKSYVDGQDALRLALTGGTLTGGLILSGNPTTVNQAANKAYVDSAVLGGPFLNLAGGTTTGAVTVGGLLSSSTGRILSTLSGPSAQASIGMHQPSGSGALGPNAVGFWNGNNQINIGNVDGNGVPTSFWHMIRSDGFFMIDTTFALYETIIPVGQPGTGLYRQQQYASQWVWQWNGTTGDLSWLIPSSATNVRVFAVFRTRDLAFVNALGPMIATSFVPASDTRLKTNVINMAYNISTLMALRPVEFNWLNPDGSTGAHDCGLLAQEVQPSYGEAVKTAGITLPDGSGGIDDANPTLGVDQSTMMALVVKCLQDINTRVTALEAP
jgi:hypothetical protein